MGSTPTSASLFVRAVVVIAATAFAGQNSAQAQIGVLPGFNAPVPGSAPSLTQEEELEIGPFAPGGQARSGGTTVNRYSDEEMSKYFDGRVADEYFEDPNCADNERVCWGYLQLDCLYWDRVHASSSTVARLASSNAVILNGRSFIWNDLEALPRLTGGYVMDNGWAVEGTYIYKDDLDTGAQAVNADALNMVAFGTPSAAFAPNFFQVDLVGMRESTGIQSAEVSMIQTNNYFNVIAGVRWIELQDRLWVNVIDDATFSSATFSTYSKLFGGQFGLRMNQTYAGIYGVQAQVKAGYYVNYSRSNTTITNAGAGLPDQARASHGNSDAFVGEAELMATYNPRIWFQMRVGVQVFTIMQTALAEDQIFDTNFSGISMRTASDIVYWGPFAGVELMW